MKKVIFLGVTIFLSILLSGCQFDDEETGPLYPSDYPEIVEVFSENHELIDISSLIFERPVLDYSLKERRLERDASDSPNTPYTFSDPNLNQAVIDHLIEQGLFEEGDVLTIGDLIEITEIDLSNKGISSIVGIEHMISLEKIDLSYNHDLTVIDGLFSTRNINLKYVDISYTAVDSLSKDFGMFASYAQFNTLIVTGSNLHYFNDISNLLLYTGLYMDIRETTMSYDIYDASGIFERLDQINEGAVLYISFDQIEWTDKLYSFQNELSFYLFDEEGNSKQPYLKIDGIEFVDKNPNFSSDLGVAMDYLKEVIRINDTMTDTEKVALILSYFIETYKDMDLQEGTNNLIDIVKGQTPTKAALNQLVRLVIHEEDIMAYFREDNLNIDFENGTSLVIDDIFDIGD